MVSSLFRLNRFMVKTFLKPTPFGRKSKKFSIFSEVAVLESIFNGFWHYFSREAVRGCGLGGYLLALLGGRPKSLAESPKSFVDHAGRGGEERLVLVYKHLPYRHKWIHRGIVAIQWVTLSRRSVTEFYCIANTRSSFFK